ncbi:VCBS domain-containing protein [Yoonia sp. 208BN28-4]|uniref:VCBS domain-containing protein n=1 Tax=Yoonia sp. 208BN28-4 TaxID=3126505 RepID=UPI00309757E0
MPTLIVDATGATGGFTSIQAAITAAAVGDTITVVGGTYTEDLTLDKSLTIVADAGATVTTGSITISPLADGSVVTIDGIDFDAAEATANSGVRYAGGYTDTANVALNIYNVDVTGFSQNGVAINGGGAGLDVSFVNVTTSENGGGSSGGSGDFSLFEFIGDASLTDVTISGTTGTADHAFQIAGFEDVGAHTVGAPAGTITFSNVSVTGNYEKTLLYVQGYNDLSGINFSGLTVGDAGSSSTNGAGPWPPVYIDPMAGAGTYSGPADGVTNLDLTGLTIGATYGGFGSPNSIFVQGTSGPDEYIGTDSGTTFVNVFAGDTITLSETIAPADLTFVAGPPDTWTIDLGNGATDIFAAPASGEVTVLDAQGNSFALGNSASNLDTIEPSVVSAVFDDLLVNEADDAATVTLTITFSEAMNMAVTPTVSLAGGAGTSLTAPSVSGPGLGWQTATTYKIAYTVDETGDDEISDIAVLVSDAKDAGGNTLSPTVGGTLSGTELDTTADASGDLTVAFVNDPMSMSFAGDTTFNENEDIQIAVSGLDAGTTGTLTVTSGMTTVTHETSIAANGTITLSAANKALLPDGPLSVNLDVTDNNSNTASAMGNSFNLETVKPTVTSASFSGVDGNDGVISDADAGGTVALSIAFSEPMDTSAPADVVVAGIPAGLTESSSVTRAWSGNTLTITYDVTDNNMDDLANISVDISGAKDQFGNSMTAETGRSTSTAIDLVNPFAVSGGVGILENPDGLPQSVGSMNDDVVVTFSVTDGDTFAITSNPGNAFKIVGNELQIADATALDREDLGEVLLVAITATDDAGNTTDFTYSVSLADVNDAATVPAGQAGLVGNVNERVDMPADEAAENNPTGFEATGSFTFDDDDLGDNHFLSVTPLATDAPGGVFFGTFFPGISTTATGAATGVIDWSLESFDAAEMAVIDALGDGETITQVFRITITDSEGATTNQPVTVTITGTNDAPEVTATVDHTQSKAETETSLDFTGTISLRDVDTTDEVTLSAVAVSTDDTTGNVADDATLLAMFDTAGATVIANGDTTGTYTWNFSTTDGFDYLAVGESVTLTYTLTFSDDSSTGNDDITQDVVLTVTGTNDAPQISLVGMDSATGAANEGNGTLTDSGTLTVTDLDVTNTVATQVDAVVVTGGDATAVDNATLAAMMSVDTVDVIDNTATVGTINWQFNSGIEAFDFLNQSETLELTYLISANDGTESATQNVVVTITGTNDVPTISAETASTAATEDGPAVTVNLADFGDDLDDENDGANLTYTIVTGPAEGSATITGTTLSFETDADFQDLQDGQTRTVSVVVKATDARLADSANQTFTFTVTGANDAPTISVATDVSETIEEGDGALSTSGSFTVEDVDTMNLVEISAVATAATGTLPTAPLDLSSLFSAVNVGDTVINTANTTGGVHWSFNSNAGDFDYLAHDESITLTYTVSVTDGTETVSQDVTITVNGTNDQPVVTTGSADTGIRAETTDADMAGNLAASGTLTVTDVDLTDTHTIAKSLASLTITDGSSPVSVPLGLNAAVEAAFTATNATANTTIDWAFSLADTNVDFLAAGDTLTAVFDVTADDDNGFTAAMGDEDSESAPKQVTITITGTNDAPVIDGSAGASGAATEPGETDPTDPTGDDGTVMTSGTLGFSDVDNSDTFTAEVVGVAITSGNSTDMPLTTGDLQGLMTITDEDAGTLGINVTTPNGLQWTFTSGEGRFDYLTAGESLVLDYTLRVTDNNAATDDQIVTVTINGTNDEPIVTVANPANFDEGDSIVTLQPPAPAAADMQTVDLLGTATITEVDESDAQSVSAISVTSTTSAGVLTALGGVSATDIEGLFTIGAGVITFDKNALLFDRLDTGQAITVDVQFDVTSGPDTVTRTVTLTVDGANDAPYFLGTAADFAETITELTNADGSENMFLHQQDFTLGFDDVELTQSHTATITPTLGTMGDTPALANYVGTFSPGFPQVATGTGTGEVSFRFQVQDSVIENLSADQSIVQRYKVLVTDNQGASVEEDIVVTIQGTNDAPDITAIKDSTGAALSASSPKLVEDQGAVEEGQTDTQSLTGSIEFDDVDVNSLAAAPKDADTHMISAALSAATIGGVDATGNLAAAYTGAMQTALTFDLSDMATLANDTSGVANVANWTFEITDKDFDFVAAGEEIALTYTVTVTDEFGGTATQDMTLVVTGTNDIPVLGTAATLADATEGDVITVTVAQLLEGWSDVDDSDDLSVNGDDLDVSGTSLSVANFTASGDATWTYDAMAQTYTITPPTDFNGTITIDYDVTDGIAPQAAQLSFDVAAVADGDIVATRASVNPVLLDAGGNLMIAGSSGIPGDNNQFVVATDANDAPGVEIALTAKIAFTGGQTVDPSDATGGSYVVPGGARAGTAQNGSSPTAARWNVDYSIGADTDMNGGTLGDRDYVFEIFEIDAMGAETSIANWTLADRLQAAEDAMALPAGSTAAVLATNTLQFTENFEFLESEGQIGSFDPAAPGLYRFEIRAENGANGSEELAASINIRVNSTPEADADVANVIEAGEGVTGSAVATGNVLDNDDDPDLAPVADTGELLVTSVNFGGTDYAVAATGNTIIDTPLGQLAIAADGSYTYTIDPVAADSLNTGNAPTEQFTYTVTDPDGRLTAVTTDGDPAGVDQEIIDSGTTTSTLTVTITGTNDAPVANAVTNPNVVEEDETFSGALVTGMPTGPGQFPISAFATDAETALGFDAFTFDSVTIDGGMAQTGAAALAAAGITYDNMTGALSFDGSVAAYQGLAKADEVDVVIGFTVTDGNGSTDSNTVTFTVRGTNDTPVISLAMGDSDSGMATETGDTNGTDVLTDSGTLTLTDADITDSHMINATASTPVWKDAGGAVVMAYPASLTIPTATFTATNTTDNDTINWAFSVADAAVDFLSAGETLTYVYDITADDGAGAASGRDEAGTSAVQQVTVTVTGTNDAPIINSMASGVSGSIIENAAADMIPSQNAVATGTIAFADADANDLATASVSTAAADVTVAYIANIDTTVSPLPAAIDVAALRGAFSVNSAGAWTYDAAALDLEALADGDTVTLTYTVEVTDGDETVSQDVVITLTGTNDAPTAVGDTTNYDTMVPANNVQVTDEDTAITIDVLANDTDVDATDGPANFTLNSVMLTGVTGALTDVMALGTDTTATIVGNQLVFTPGAAFDVLDLNDTAVVTVSYQMQDDSGATSSATATITVVGTNDQPTIGDVNIGGLVDTAANDLFAATPDIDGAMTGTITAAASDVDDAAVLTYTIAGQVLGGMDTSTSLAGTYGTLTINTDGSYGYEANAAAINAASGAATTDTFTIQVTDENGASDTSTLTVDITPANDTPEIAAPAVGAIVDTAATTDMSADGFTTSNLSGTLMATDRDDAAAGAGQLEYAISGQTVASGATSQSFFYNQTSGAVTSAPGMGLIALGTLTVNSNGAYDFAPDAAGIDALDAGNVPVITTNVRATDGGGLFAETSLTINVTGVNDNPVITTTTPAVTMGVVEVTAQELAETDTGTEVTSGGTITFTDVDSDNIPSFGFQQLGAGYQGTIAFSPAAGTVADSSAGWTFEIDNSVLNSLADGEALDTSPQQYNIRVFDGDGGEVLQQVSITIIGSNDTPVITGALTSGGALEAADGVVDETITTSGTLNVSDEDTSDTVSVAVTNAAITMGGTYAGPLPVALPSALPSMMQVREAGGTFAASTGAMLADGPAGTDFDWAFTSAMSGDNAFGFLANGETLEIAYTLTATDANTKGGTAGATTEQVVTITVTGTNDGPVAAGDVIVSANENVPDTQVLATASADDTDLTDTVSYAITTGAAGLFEIDSTSGEITLIDGVELDAEAGQQYILTVTASDVLGLTDTQQITINVNDLDDNITTAPVDSAVAANEVDENATAGTTVGITANSTDADVTSGAVSYAITGGTGASDFEINANSGVVTVKAGADIDREADENLTIEVTATPANGAASAVSTFTIQINDLDEVDVTQPADVNAAENEVSENASAGTAVGITVLATDGDATTNGVTYAITDGDPTGIFAIDGASGVVTLSSVAGAPKPDFETATTHTLTITATSQDGSTASDMFTVKILDANDNAPVFATNAVQTAAENQTAVVDLAATDVDTPVSGISFTLNGGADESLFEITEVGGVSSLSFKAAPDFEAAQTSFEVVVNASDGVNSTDQTITVSVTDVNEAPTNLTLDNAVTTLAENTVIGSGIKVADITVTDDAIVTDNMLMLTGDDASFFAIVHTPGGPELHFTGASPDFENASDFSGDGTYDVTVQVDDVFVGGSPDASAVFALEVTNVNEAPEASIIPAGTFDTVDEDETFSGTVTATGMGIPLGAFATDVDGNIDPSSLTFTAATVNGAAVAGLSVAGISYDGATGLFGFDGGAAIYQPLDPGTEIDVVISFTATDGGGLVSNTGSVTFTVRGTNDLPVIDAASSQVSPVGTEDNNVTGAVVFTDVDTSASIGYAVVNTGTGAPASGSVTIDATSGAYIYTPSADFNGTDAFTVTVTDGQGSTVTQVVNVQVNAVDDAPEAGNTTATTDEDNSTTIDVGTLINERDGDTVTVTASVSPAQGTVSVSGTEISFDPAEDFNGLAVITYTVTDDTTGALSDTGTVNVTVNAINDAPEVENPIADQGGTEDQSFSFTVPANAFADVDDATLSYSLGMSSPIWLSINAVSGVISGTPPQNFNGAVNVEVIATDAAGLTASDTFALDIAAVNDATEIDNTLQPFSEHVEAIDDAAPVPTAVAPLVTLTDVDGLDYDGAVFTASVGGSDATDRLALDESGLIEISSDAVLLSGNQIATVTGLNTGALTVSFINAPSLSDVQTVVQALTYATTDDTPQATRSVRLDLTDGDGGVAMHKSVGVLIVSKNDSPNAIDDTFILSEGAFASGLNLLTLDLPDNDPEFNSLSVTEVEDVDDSIGLFMPASDSVSPSASGVITTDWGAEVTLAANGQLLYNLTSATAKFNELGAGEIATDQFKYTISDGFGGTDTATVSVQIVGVNDAIVAVADAITTTEDAAATATGNLLTNDTDQDVNDDRTIINVAGTVTASVAAAAGGFQVTTNDGVIVNVSTDGSYTLSAPDALVGGQVYTATFLYTVQDDGSAQSTTTVTVEVTGDNDAPTAANVTLTASDEDTVRTITASELLAGASDVDSTTLTVTQLTLTSGNGGLVDNMDGTWTYTPFGDDDSAVTFTYEVSDGALVATASADLDLLPVNDAPVGTPAILGTVEEDATLTVDISGISDADGLGAFSYQWLADGVAIVGANADSFTPGDAEVGAAISVTVSYTDSNGTAEEVTSDATAPVANVNDAPVGTPTIVGVAEEDATLTVDTSGISDADGLGAFSYQWLADGVAIVGANADSFTPGDAEVGAAISVSVSYTDANGTAEEITSDATAPVTNVNDAPVGTPVIVGTVEEDATLTVDTSGITDDDGLGAFSYQWLADGVAISGANADSFTPGDTEVGKSLSVTVSYTDVNGTAEEITSAATAPVANVNDPLMGSPFIVGSVVEEDAPLFADTFTMFDADGLGPFSYQWLADGVAIAGATDSTFTPGDAEVGKALTVTVSYIDDNGTAEERTSGATVPVANVNDAPIGGMPSITVSENTGDQSLDLLAGAADVDSLLLTVSNASVSNLTFNGVTEMDFVPGTPLSNYGTFAGSTFTIDTDDPNISADDGDTIVLSISYTIEDEDGGQTMTSATFTLNGVDDLTEGDDIYFGTEGDDYIDALGGDDLVDARGGNDTVLDGAGDDIVFGGIGDDLFIAGSGANDYDGEDGYDTLDYSASSRGLAINLETGDNTGGEAGNAAGNDSFINIEGLIGGQGDDILTGTTGNNTIAGGDGGDLILDLGGDDFIFGNDGDDVFKVGAGANTFDGGAGDDLLDYSASGRGISLNLATGDTTGGQAGNAAGNDAFTDIEGVIGGRGGDILTGSDLDNLLSGGAGADVILGMGGNDLILDGSGSDTVFGGDGDDYFTVGSGANTITGDDGSDTADYSAFQRGLQINLTDGTTSGGATGNAAGNDVLVLIENIIGSNGDDVLLGDAQSNRFEGGTGNDRLSGRGGDDSIFGGDGDDSIWGGGGADVLSGGDGADWFDGGAGSDLDILIGGAGADTFHFDMGEGVDTILDFEAGIDTLELDNFGYLTTSADVAAYASEMDGDLILDFGTDGFITIENATLMGVQDDFQIV